jgi:hypothetical protein
VRPAGYMYKRVSRRPEWLKADGVVDLYSVSGCSSEFFGNYIDYWKHNGLGLFDDPETIRELATEQRYNLSGMTLFYYEVFDQEFDDESKTWSPLELIPSLPLDPKVPNAAVLVGYDVVTFSAGPHPECSPLSCNSVAEVIETNTHCLLESFDSARLAVELGSFDNCEPGPFRIFAVYSI